MVAPSRTDAARACTHPRADDADVATPLARRRSPRRAGFGGAFPGRPAAICSPIARLHLVPMPPCSACRLSPAPISRLASRTHLPASGPLGAPERERRFESAGWAAATVAAVAVVAAAAALPTPRPPQSRRGAAPARAHTHPSLAGTGVKVDRAGGRAAGASSGAARGVSGAPVRLSVSSRPVARPPGPVLPISQSRTISYIHLLGWGVTASPGVD